MTSSISSEPPANWISPQEQIERLTGIPEYLVPNIINSSIRFDRDPVPVEAEGLNLSRFTLFDLCVNKMSKLDPILTGWYKALVKLKALPDLLPPLPEDICEILDSTCPIFGNRLKAEDMTPYKIRDTHFLAPILENFKNINRFTEDILMPYANETYREDQNPFRRAPFGYRYHGEEEFLHEAGETSFAPTHWGLMTLSLLPGSRARTLEELEGLVKTVNPGVYETPTLQQSYVALAIHKVATGKNAYLSAPFMEEGIEHRSLLSHVKKMGRERTPFTISCDGVSGLSINCIGSQVLCPGVAPFRQLS